MTTRPSGWSGLIGRVRDRPLWLFAALLLVVFGAAIVSLGGLSFPLHRDEYWFWRQTMFFVKHWPPGAAELRGYDEPMTPFSFLVWGAVERVTGAGVIGGRLVNIALSVALLAMIGARRRDPELRGLLAACGFLLFPYTVPLSIYVYTDVPAAFLVTLGFWLYARCRPVGSALAFALAIATRQYMVLFPLALAAAELAPAIVESGGRWRSAPRGAGGRSLADGRLRRTLPLLAAAASLGGWFLWFGGMGPQAGLEEWPRHMDALAKLAPDYGLYALSCLGAYFVLPEFVLFRRWREGGRLLSARGIGLGAALIVLFVLFPPTSRGVTMGPLNRLTLVLLPPEVAGNAGVLIRIAFFASLAWIACLRLVRFDVVGWIVLGHVVLMVVSFEAWEKYLLPVLAVLWYLVSSFDPSERVEVWSAGLPRRRRAEARAAHSEAPRRDAAVD